MTEYEVKSAAIDAVHELQERCGISATEARFRFVALMRDADIMNILYEAAIELEY